MHATGTEFADLDDDLQLVTLPDAARFLSVSRGSLYDLLTTGELRLRSELHARGLRFRKDLLLRVGTVRVHPEVVFTKAKVAVFLDGCFWHACPEHGTVPKRNVSYWARSSRRTLTATSA